MSELRKVFFNNREARTDEQSEMAKPEFRHMQEHAAVYVEFDKMKKEIDWEVFWKIVEEVAVKSGINFSDLNRVHQNMIVGQRDLKIKEDKNETGGGRNCSLL